MKNALPIKVPGQKLKMKKKKNGLGIKKERRVFFDSHITKRKVLISANGETAFHIDTEDLLRKASLFKR